MTNITVYGTPTCPWCVRANDYLKKKGIKFQYHDVSTDAKARSELVEKSDQMGVPVLDIDGRIIVGFDKQAIEEAIKN